MVYYFRLFLLVLFLLVGESGRGQDLAGDALRVVFHLTTSDSLAHRALVKQLTNFLTAAPGSQLEVVCHNNGITFLQKGLSGQVAFIDGLRGRGVDFVACENTMRERGILHEQLVAGVRTVKAGVVEVVRKQQLGWAYIKAGF
jgi:intracellular sulfur oxidation DsrE/DsrF family protein